MKGAPVWDIHVSSAGKVWDVKVSVSDGTVLLKRLSNEKQSSANIGSNSRDSSPDLTGHSKSAESHDKQDKKNQQNKKNQEDHGRGVSYAPASVGGVVFGQKLTTVPVVYQVYVNQALAKVGGTLKWVKFSHKGKTDIQMNIKIHKASGGATKVKDVFNAANQLAPQSTSSDR